ncbi:MAG: anti-sigma factor family protein [Bryobacteraceae bacterium]
MPQNWEHITEETLEQYSLGILPEDEQRGVEEHLFVCPDCQRRLTETDQYVRAMQEAAAEYRRRHPRKEAKRAPKLDWPVHRPRLIWALGAACLLWLVIWKFAFQDGGGGHAVSPVAVQLLALRDAATGDVAAWAPLRLIAELNGLPERPLWRLDIVDAAGGTVGSFEARPEGGRLEVEIRQGLPPGQYWVRVCEPGAGVRVQREFGLRVR